MNEPSLYKAFNARWISPEDVARKFVPIPQFSALLGWENCVLAGPRGCGKTTLLKMLTRRAQKVLAEERATDVIDVSSMRPSFEAIYIPSDVRWSYELGAITKSLENEHLGELSQRALITSNGLACALGLFERRLKEHLTADVRAEVEHRLATLILGHFGFRDRIPTLGECVMSLRALSSDIRGLINFRDADRLRELLTSASPRLCGHALDSVINACYLYNEAVPEQLKVYKWGICFDEVEIAPVWFGRELFKSLRSLEDQNFYLKFTWSPILPPSDETGAQESNDYDPIKLWSSHVVDPKEFCEALTKKFLRSKFPAAEYCASDLLGASVFASEGAGEEPSEIYKKGSVLHNSMIELALKDTKFVEFIERKGIDLEAGFIIRGETGAVMDKVFRKIKPIVLMRNEFLEGERRRTRKRVTLYSGKEAVFAMSEGNPRRLLGLLNDLCELYEFKQDFPSSLEKPADALLQAKILSKVSSRALTLLRSTPVYPEEPDRVVRFSLFELVDKIGKYMSDAFYKGEFQTDPVGSFRIEGDLSPAITDALKRLVDVGTVVPISEAHGELPIGLVGPRFRLSFILSPSFKLAFRNYKEVSLSSILGSGYSDGQMEFTEFTS